MGETPPGVVDPPRSDETPFVGRAKERILLAQALAEAKKGRGSAWMVEGTAGIGKTRLVRGIQDVAEAEGFRTLWGYALKEISTPFFPFQQLFHALASTSGTVRSPPLPDPLPSLATFEEERPRLLFDEAAKLSQAHPCIVVSRERPARVRSRWPSLSAAAPVLWLSKGEGEEHFSPGELNKLGELLTAQLERFPGCIVALTGIDYLVSQNAFTPVLHFLQFLRDHAEARGGHLLLSLNPRAFTEREVALLEGEGHVSRPPPPAPARAAPTGAEPPTSTMIRYIDTLELEAAYQPLLLAIDDVQWADPDSLRALQFLARNIRRIPVAIVVARKTEETGAAPDPSDRLLLDLVDAMQREGTLHRLPLEGMSAADASDLARGLLGAPVVGGTEDEGLLELLRRTGGNPFFLKETIRELLATGRIRRDGPRFRIDLSSVAGVGDDGAPTLPESVRRLVARRLGRLSEVERGVLEWAAVAGSEFDLAPLEGVVPSAFSPVSPIVEGLAGRERWLEQRGGGRWAFVQLQVWETTLAELGEPERTRRARRLADWWSTLRPNEVETIARLYHDAKDPVGGIPWVRKALDGALKARSLGLVERYYRWLHELLELGGADREARVEEGLSVVERLFEATGSSYEGASMLRSLQSLAPPGPLERELEAYLALSLAVLAPGEAVPMIQRLRGAISAEGASAKVLAILGLAAAISAARSGQGPTQAEAEASKVLGDPKELPVWLRARLLYESGTALTRMGRRDLARARAEELRALAETSFDPRRLGLLRSLESFLNEQEGLVADHRRTNEQALRLAPETGNPIAVAVSLSNLTETYILEGDLDSARRTVSELRRHCERFRIERAPFQLPLLEGQIASAEGRNREAIQLFEEAKNQMRRMEQFDQLDLARVLLAGCLAGERQTALARREVHDASNAAGGLEARLRPWIPLLEGRCDALDGQAEQARTSFDRGLALAEAEGNLFNQGLALNHLARWEESFGEPQHAREFWDRSKAVMDRSGILVHGWARTWPPGLEERRDPGDGSASGPAAEGRTE